MWYKKRSINIIIEDCLVRDIYFENSYYKHHAWLDENLCDDLEDLYWSYNPIIMAKLLQKILQKNKAFQYLDINEIFQNCIINIYINDTHYQYRSYKNKLI